MPTATTTFDVADQICSIGIIIKPFQYADGIYNTESKTYVQPKRVYPGMIQAGQDIGCGIPQLPKR